MKKMNDKIFWIGAIILTFFFLAGARATHSDVMTVGANILNWTVLVPESAVRISVPDSIFLGNVSIGEISEEIQIRVNNTGTVNITVRPQLLDTPDPVFRNIYFRETKTKNGEPVPFARIGDFTFNISKPTTGGFRSKSFYMMLNLTDFTGTLESNVVNYEADIRFFAAAA